MTDLKLNIHRIVIELPMGEIQSVTTASMTQDGVIVLDDGGKSVRCTFAQLNAIVRMFGKTDISWFDNDAAL